VALLYNTLLMKTSYGLDKRQLECIKFRM